MRSKEEKGKDRKNETRQEDYNLVFLMNLDKSRPSEKMQANGKLKDQLKAIKTRLQPLEREEKEEWSHLITLKCQHLLKKGKQNELKACLKILILLSSQLGISYNRSDVQKILKATYFNEYGESILPEFKKAGLSVDDYEVWEYKDPWYSRVLNFLTFSD